MGKRTESPERSASRESRPEPEHHSHRWKFLPLFFLAHDLALLGVTGAFLVLRGLIVVEVVVLFQKDLDRQFIACNLLLVSSKSIAKSIGDWIRSKSIVDLVASFLVICHELQFVLVVALNLVLVAIEMVVRVVDIVSSLLL